MEFTDGQRDTVCKQSKSIWLSACIQEVSHFRRLHKFCVDLEEVNSPSILVCYAIIAAASHAITAADPNPGKDAL